MECLKPNEDYPRIGVGRTMTKSKRRGESQTLVPGIKKKKKKESSASEMSRSEICPRRKCGKEGRLQRENYVA